MEIQGEQDVIVLGYFKLDVHHQTAGAAVVATHTGTTCPFTGSTA